METVTTYSKKSCCGKYELSSESESFLASREAVFGWEVQLDLYDCDEFTISNEEKIKNFGLELCKVIDMIPFGPAYTPYFGDNNEITKGYSLLQFIETSSITGHFSEGTGAAYLNIFSCKAFDAKAAEDFSREYFQAGHCISRVTTRK